MPPIRRRSSASIIDLRSSSESLSPPPSPEDAPLAPGPSRSRTASRRAAGAGRRVNFSEYVEERLQPADDLSPEPVVGQQERRARRGGGPRMGGRVVIDISASDDEGDMEDAAEVRRRDAPRTAGRSRPRAGGNDRFAMDLPPRRNRAVHDADEFRAAMEGELRCIDRRLDDYGRRVARIQADRQQARQAIFDDLHSPPPPDPQPIRLGGAMMRNGEQRQHFGALRGGAAAGMLAGLGGAARGDWPHGLVDYIGGGLGVGGGGGFGGALRMDFIAHLLGRGGGGPAHREVNVQEVVGEATLPPAAPVEPGLTDNFDLDTHGGDGACLGCVACGALLLDKVYSLRCGHMLDDACLHVLSVPTPDQARLDAHPPLEALQPARKRAKTRARAAKTRKREYEWKCPVPTCGMVHASVEEDAAKVEEGAEGADGHEAPRWKTKDGWGAIQVYV